MSRAILTGVRYMTWLLLAFAILGEVIGTTALKLSDGFSRPSWTALSIAGYVVAFYLLSIVLRTIPVGIAYAIWAGVGVALVALIGVFAFDQRLDAPAVVGMSLIVAGVIVLNTMSGVSGH